MIELGLVLLLCLVSFLLTRDQAPPTPSDLDPSSDERRLLGAVRRACSGFLWREARLLAVVLGASAAGFSILAWQMTLPRSRAHLASMFCSALLGAGLSCALAHFSYRKGLSASLTELAGRRRSAETGRWIIQGVSRVASVGNAGSLTVVLTAFAANYWWALLSTQCSAPAAAWYAATCLPAIALGAVCGGAVFQVGGNSFQTASSVASSAARTDNPNLTESAALNPAMVAEFSGKFVGTLVSRSTDALTLTILGDVSLVLLCTNLARGEMSSERTLTLIALPLLLRSVGGVASCLVASSQRFDPPYALPPALARIALATVGAVGVLGTLFWVVGGSDLWVFSGAGLLGLTGALVSSGSNRSEPQGAAGGGDRLNTETARAIGLGLQRTILPLALVAACFCGAWWLGTRAEVENGAQLGVVVALATMLGCNALHLSSSLLLPFCEAAQHLSEVLTASYSSRAQAECQALCAQVRPASQHGQTQLILAGIASAILATMAIPQLVEGGPDRQLLTVPMSESGTSLADYVLTLLAGLLGAGFTIFHVGSVLRSSSRAASRVGADLLQHLRIAGNSAARLTPQTLTRGYRVSLDLAEEAAIDAIAPVAIMATAIPAGLAILLQAVYGVDHTSVVARSLVTFSILSICSGAFTALAAHRATDSLVIQHSTRNKSEPGTAVASSRGLAATNVGVSTGAPLPSSSHFLGRSVSPAALLGMEAALAASLTSAPLLF